jgi:hypothetical protein
MIQKRENRNWLGILVGTIMLISLAIAVGIQLISG